MTIKKEQQAWKKNIRKTPYTKIAQDIEQQRSQQLYTEEIMLPFWTIAMETILRIRSCVCVFVCVNYFCFFLLMSAHCLVIDGTWSDEHSRFISVISFPNTRSVRCCWFLAFDQNTEFCLSFHIGQFYVVNFTTRTFPTAIRRIEYTSIIFRNKRHSDGQDLYWRKGIS